MRSSLANVLRDECDHPEAIQRRDEFHPYSEEEDEAACEAKIDEIRPLITGLISKDKKKVETKLCHLLGRIKRMERDAESRTGLLQEAMELLEQFQAKVASFAVPPELELLEKSLNDALQFEARTTSTPRSERPPLSPPSVKGVPVYKWNLTFSGRPEEQSVSAFLERVDELMIARGISKRELFESAVDLFEDHARKWFRLNRSNLNSWEELASALRLEFQPHNYSDKLFQEIRQRTQGRDEPVGVFIDNIATLFGRLVCPVSEAARVKIILDNLLPFYQSQLALIEVESVEKLRKLCKQLEARREAVDNFVPPARVTRGRLLEPDVAYVDTFVEKPSQSPRGNGPKCFNCGKIGHMSFNCDQPRTRKCSKCQRPGVTSHTCSRCSGNGSRRK